MRNSPGETSFWPAGWRETPYAMTVGSGICVSASMDMRYESSTLNES